MKTAALLLTTILSFNFIVTNAMAEIKPDYDVPVSEDDVRPDDQPKVDHKEFRLKKFKCSDGEEYGLLYEKTWGYSLTTRALGMCSWDNAESLTDCDAETSDEIRKCYDEALVKYNLKAKYLKLAQEKNGTADEETSGADKKSRLNRSAKPMVPAKLPVYKPGVSKRFPNGPQQAPSSR